MVAKKTIAAVIIAFAGLAGAMPAGAQGVSFDFGAGAPQFRSEDGYRWSDRRGGFDRVLSPREVRRILRNQGYRNIDTVDRRGSIYQVRATTERGRRVGLVVSARSGAILNRYRL
jgi:hypothetical protein